MVLEYQSRLINAYGYLPLNLQIPRIQIWQEYISNLPGFDINKPNLLEFQDAINPDDWINFADFR